MALDLAKKPLLGLGVWNDLLMKTKFIGDFKLS